MLWRIKLISIWLAAASAPSTVVGWVEALIVIEQGLSWQGRKREHIP